MLTKKTGRSININKEPLKQKKINAKKTRLCVCIEARKQCVNSEKVKEKLLKLIDSKVMKTITKNTKRVRKQNCRYNYLTS